MKKILKALLIVVAVLAAAFAALLLFLTVTEYKPADEEAVEIISGTNADSERKTPGVGGEITVVSWNIGYGALGDNADFFMDGGRMVQTADRERVQKNMADITDVIGSADADVVFLQEVDQNSSRSYGIDETALCRDRFPEMESAFTWNFKTAFVPYPVPPIGRVSSGLLMLSDFAMNDARRIKLPCPFSWPVSMANLKRCLLTARIPLEDSEKELVLVNLHLEAYDDGEGKAAQTAMLKEILENERKAGNYVIAGGDFNQTFSNISLDRYEIQDGKWAPGIVDVSEIGGGWQCLMDEEVPSCRSLDQPYAGADQDSFQYYVIDGFLVSDNLEVTSFECRQENFASTDHNPLVLTVRLG